MQTGFGGTITRTSMGPGVGAPGESVGGVPRGVVHLFSEDVWTIDRDTDGLPDSWEVLHWGGVVGHGCQDDSDHDGVDALMELAHWMDPTVADSSGQPRPVLDGDYLTLTVQKYPGVQYLTESAGALDSGHPEWFSTATTTVLTDITSSLVVRDNTPVSSAAPAS